MGLEWHVSGNVVGDKGGEVNRMKFKRLEGHSKGWILF